MRAQLSRPTFEPLIDRCQLLRFEEIEEQVGRLEGLGVESGARVSGLIRGELFDRAHHHVLPSVV